MEDILINNKNLYSNLSFLSNIAVPLIIIDNKNSIKELNDAAYEMFHNIYMNRNIDISNDKFKNILWFIKDEFLSLKVKMNLPIVFIKK